MILVMERRGERMVRKLEVSPVEKESKLLSFYRFHEADARKQRLWNNELRCVSHSLMIKL